MNKTVAIEILKSLYRTQHNIEEIIEKIPDNKRVASYRIVLKCFRNIEYELSELMEADDDN